LRDALPELSAWWTPRPTLNTPAIVMHGQDWILNVREYQENRKIPKRAKAASKPKLA
jgi:hypothetical protein